MQLLTPEACMNVSNYAFIMRFMNAGRSEKGNGSCEGF